MKKFVQFFGLFWHEVLTLVLSRKRRGHTNCFTFEEQSAFPFEGEATCDPLAVSKDIFLRALRHLIKQEKTNGRNQGLFSLFG
jgi:hypothetical protein